MTCGIMVSIVDIQEEAGTATAAEFSSKFKPSHVIFIHCDITNREEFTAAFDQTIEKFGGLDIVCSNAGVILEREWEKAIKINLIGTFYGIDLAMQRMGRQNGGNGGVIINTASLVGIYGFPALPVYASCKAAICMYTKCLAARQLTDQGVRINALCPDKTDTPIIEAAIMEGVGGEEKMREFMEEYPPMPASKVADAAYQLITDDTKNGTLLQVFASACEEYQFPEYSPFENK